MPFIKCSKCETGEVLHGPDTDPPEKPICPRCYIPRNPTDGWMLNKCATNPEFNELRFRQMHSGDKKKGWSTEQKNYLRETLRLMGIRIKTKKKAQSEKKYIPER